MTESDEESEPVAEDSESEDKPSEDSPSEEKPLEEKLAEENPSEDMPSEDKTSEDTPSADQLPEGKRSEKNLWLSYDFNHPQHRLSERVPQLEIGGESLAYSINRLVDNVLHIPCKVSLQTASLVKYQEFVEGIEQRACVFDCALSPMQASALLCFDQYLITKMVEKYFGGTSPTTDSPERVYSTTEKRLANRLHTCVIKAINEVWAPLFSASETGSGLLSRTEVLVAEAESSIVAVLRCQVVIDDSEVNFSVVLPWQALLLIRRSSALCRSDQVHSDTRWTRAMAEQISTCEVDVHGLLAETRVTVEHLLKMQVGDFIPLGEQQTATFMIDNAPVFNALIGSNRAQVSASFLNWIEHGESSK